MQSELKYSLQELRVRKGYTQEDMANKLCLSRQAYINIEKNPSKVTIKRMLEIASILDVTIDDIFFPIKPHK